MLAHQLAADLDRRAGSFLSAAQFAAAPDALRAASLLGTAGTVAQDLGLSGVRGYLAALERLEDPTVEPVRRAIRDAIDAALEAVSLAAWTGRLPRAD